MVTVSHIFSFSFLVSSIESIIKFSSNFFRFYFKIILLIFHLFWHLVVRYIVHRKTLCIVPLFQYCAEVFGHMAQFFRQVLQKFHSEIAALWIQSLYSCLYSALQDTGGFWILITSWSSWVMWLSWWIQSHGLSVKCLSVCVWRNWHL